MKKILFNLFRENRILFLNRESGPSGVPSVPKAPKEARSARLVEKKVPSVTVKEGQHSDDIETWCEELRDKCDDVKALAAPITDNQSEYTHGFVVKSVEIYNKADKVKADLSGDAHSWLYTDHSTAQMKEHQHEIDVFEAALVGESGYGSTEREKNKDYLRTKESEDARMAQLTTDVVTITADLKTKLPKELGDLYSNNFSKYAKDKCLPLGIEANSLLKKAMEAKTNTEIDAYIGEAQGKIDEADSLAQTYVDNIDEFDAAIRPTLDDKTHSGKIFTIVNGSFEKEVLATFDKADKTAKGALKPLGEGLVTGYEPIFEMATKAEELLKDPSLQGVKTQTLQAPFEDEMKNIFKKTPINAEEAVTAGNTLIDVYKSKAKVADKLDKLTPELTGTEGQVVLKTAEGELDTLLAKRGMTKEDAEAEQVKLIAGWDAKVEQAKKIDAMKTEAGYGGAKCEAVFVKIRTEADKVLKTVPCEDPAKVKTDIDAVLKATNKELQMAALMDGTGKTDVEIKKALSMRDKKDKKKIDPISQGILTALEANPLNVIAARYAEASQINLSENTDVFEQFSGDGYKGWKQVNKAFALKIGVKEADYDKDGGESFKEVVRGIQTKLGKDINGKTLVPDGAIGPLTMGAIAAWKAKDPKYAEVKDIGISDTALVAAPAQPKKPNAVAKAQGKKKGQGPAISPKASV